MRIVHLIQSFQIGGLEKMVLHLAVGARQRGHAVDVVASLDDGPLRRALTEAGVGAHVLGARAGLAPRTSLALARLLRQRRATHLHTHHLGPFLYGTGARPWVGHRVAHLHTEHSHEFYDHPRRRLAGRLMERVADVVACSDEVACFRREALGADSVVIENGVPAAPASPDARRRARGRLGIDDDVPLVLAVARLAPEKDHVRLVRAFRRVVDAVPRSRLVLVGDGPCRAAIEAAVVAHGLDRQVELLGARDDVAALLPAADVIAFSSRREALPLALLEALAAGVPFAGTDVGELPALAQAGAGLVAADEEGLAGALTRLLVERALRERLAADGHALWQRRFSVDTMVERYLERYALRSAC
jgi:glycosyltransferase involved in cell wall biosynthesis